MIGRVRLGVKPGDPGTGADEADVTLRVELSDVRRSSTLADYAGELELVLGIRVTDKLNGAAAEAATMADQAVRTAVPCTVTVSDAEGSVCTISTTLDTLIPGVIAERARAIWALDEVALNDGGADGDADTADNTPFAVPGIFIP